MCVALPRTSGLAGAGGCPVPLPPQSPAAVARGLRMTTRPAAMPRGGNRVASFNHDARPNILLLFRIAATNASARWKRPPAYQLFVAVTGLRAFADRRDRGHDCRTGDGGTPRIDGMQPPGDGSRSAVRSRSGVAQGRGECVTHLRRAAIGAGPHGRRPGGIGQVGQAAAFQPGRR
jgi:hypothetical protein